MTTTEERAGGPDRRAAQKAVLCAPKDLQHTALYGRVLARLRERHGAEGVVADRDLYATNSDYRRRWREDYAGFSPVYLLAREDGTVGRGLYQQWGYVRSLGAETVLILADGDSWSGGNPGGNPGGSSQGAFEERRDFWLKRLEIEDGHDDARRHAAVVAEPGEDEDRG